MIHSKACSARPGAVGRRTGPVPAVGRFTSVTPQSVAVQRGEAVGRQHEIPGSRRAILARARPTTDLPSGQYDYVIVGGGLAGCLLANRLSADESKKVLLIEAGEDNKDPIVKVPAGLTRLFQNPTLDWNLQTVKQAAMGGRRSYLARGKLLGGSSSTNATLYHRGTAEDYDSWGLQGWSSAEVLPWFVSMEDNPAFGDTKYHGTGGAMHVENPIYKNPLFDRHFQASAEAGYKANPDFNDWSRSQEGYGEFQVAITKRGRRADSYRQFLKPVLDRENLEVVIRTQVSKVAFETRDGTPTAVGVEVRGILPGTPIKPTGAQSSVSIAPGGEVLLTAGAIHSPHLLLASGIGPKDQLKSFNIDTVSDLSGVGKNLQDHPAILTAYEFEEDAEQQCATDHVYNNKLNIRPTQVLNWAVRGRGPLTSTGCDRGAFIKTNDSLSQPDLQVRYVAALALDSNAIDSYVKFGKLKEEGKATRWPGGMTYQLLACRPQSRGTVSLEAADVTERPAIDLAYLSDDSGADRETLRQGVRISRKMAQANAWKGMVKSEMHPGADVESDADLDDYIAKSMHSGNALVGTCAMGDANKGGVVSPESFKVHGVNGLRVVDSSVIPKIPGGQTGAPVVMVAERAAAMIAASKQTVGDSPAPHMAEPALA